ncbi:MAG: alkylhydroperoxidase-related (seleno)protein [Pseudomonadota bacterium]
MNEFPIRDTVQAEFADSWQQLRKPGAWWTAAERLAMIEEARHALQCSLCAERAQALSPNSVQGAHDHLGKLPEAAVDVIHRMRTDSGRLTHAWFDSIVPSQLSQEAYIEIVGTIGTSVVLDTWTMSTSGELQPLPQPQAGKPTNEASEPVVEDGAWVPILKVSAEQRPMSPNIMRSMALVPNIRMLFMKTFGQHYMLSGMKLSLARTQIELIAARMSALNQCYY